MTSLKRDTLQSHFRLLFQLENIKSLNSKDFVFWDIINHYHNMTKNTDFTVIISSTDWVTSFFNSVYSTIYNMPETLNLLAGWRHIMQQKSGDQFSCRHPFFKLHKLLKFGSKLGHCGVLKTVLRTIHSGVPSKSNLLLTRHLHSLKINTVFSRTSHYQLILAEDICLLWHHVVW